MSTPKHTPGPWVSTGPHTREVVTYNTSTYRPAMTIATVNGYCAGEALAHMHLIAAAPAMYEALKGCLRVTEAWKSQAEMDGDAVEIESAVMEIKRIKTALAQAEGTL